MAVASPVSDCITPRVLQDCTRDELGCIAQSCARRPDGWRHGTGLPGLCQPWMAPSCSCSCSMLSRLIVLLSLLVAMTQVRGARFHYSALAALSAPPVVAQAVVMSTAGSTAAAVRSAGTCELCEARAAASRRAGGVLFYACKRRARPVLGPPIAAEPSRAWAVARWCAALSDNGFASRRQ